MKVTAGHSQKSEEKFEKFARRKENEKEKKVDKDMKKEKAASTREKFNKMTEGPFGYFIYAVGGILIAFLLNQALAYGLSTDLPVVAVVSSSMTHDESTERVHYQWLEENLDYNRSYVDSWPISGGFLVGDLPIVAGADKYNIGDVVVYSVPGQTVPIVHRIISVNPDGSFRTKGDHNGNLLSFEYSVREEQIHGKVIFIIPKLGYFKVALTRLVGAQAS